MLDLVNLKNDRAPEILLEKIQGDVIRAQITDKVKSIKAEFLTISKEFKRYNKKQSTKLKYRWTRDSKKRPKGQRAASELARLQDLSKEFRLIALQDLSKDWYDRFWYLRSEIALITSFYDFSGLHSIPEFMDNWKPRKSTNFSPVVLRLNGPRKPKKKFKLSDIKYDIVEAYLKMMKPLEDWLDKTVSVIGKLKGVKTKQTDKAKIQRYRESITAREHVTVLCQAVAPRQPATRKNNK